MPQSRDLKDFKIELGKLIPNLSYQHMITITNPDRYEQHGNTQHEKQ